MIEFKGFPSIENLHNYIYNFKKRFDYIGKEEDGVTPIYKNTRPYPILEYTGKIKLHGTSACIAKIGEEVFFQKRSQVLGSLDDNNGFKSKMILNGDYSFLFDNYDFKESCYIYGEWCGKGIQKKVASSQVEKFFCIFAVLCDGEFVDTKNVNYPEKHIYNVSQIPDWKIIIDFNNPELAEEKINEYINQVEKEDPFMKEVFNIAGLGEGIVYYLNNKPQFKTKGEEHRISGSKENKTIQADIPMYTETITFVESVVTQARVSQAFSTLELDIRNKNNYGKIIKWLLEDILKEEMPTIIENKFSIETIKKYVPKTTIKIINEL